MHILVTGGAGFIGSHVVDELLKAGHKVIVVDNLATGDRRNLKDNVRFYRVDIGSPKLEAVFKKERPKAICHLAAKTNMRESLTDPLKDIETNIVGMVRLLELCRRYKVKKFVYSSTGGALYGNTKILPTTEKTPTKPISPYGISKMAGERYLYFYHLVYDLPVVILRYSNVHGPRLDRKKGGASATMKIIQTVLLGKRPTVTGGGKQTRDFVYVKDVARANRLAISQKKKGYFVYNISGGKETSVNDLVLYLLKRLKSPLKPKYVKAIKGEVLRSYLSNRRARRELSWRPKYSVKKGIEETLEYLEVM